MREIHAALIEAGWSNKKFPRDEMEAYLAQDMGLSLSNIRVYIDTGRVLGLWQVVDRRPRPGALIIQPAKPIETADQAPSLFA